MKIPIEGWPGYFASIDGRILSTRRGGISELRPKKSSYYPSVTLCRKGMYGPERASLHVHSLVAAAFLVRAGTPDVVRHLDGDRRNNSPFNLAYGSFSDNEADKDRHGRRLRGDDVHGSKLTETKVKAIRARFANGEPVSRLARDFGLHPTSAHRVIHGFVWKHVPTPDYSDRERERAMGSWNAGAASAHAKITEAQATEAIRRIASGEPHKLIAEALGISRQAIGHMAARRTWKHIPWPA